MAKVTKRTNWYFVVLAFAALLALLAVALLSSYHPHHTMAVRNRVRTTRLGYIQSELHAYYSRNGFFPTSLSELTLGGIAEDPWTGINYLYAFYPSEKPIAYHLGARLEREGGQAVSVEDASLSNDADFNSQAVGYFNGFDGKDPIYDLHVKKAGK